MILHIQPPCLRLLMLLLLMMMIFSCHFYYPLLALELDLIPSFRRGLVETPLGMVHYTMTGDITTADSSRLLPMVAFHMPSRSVDEYKEIMQECYSIYGNARVFVAMDEFGHGQSDHANKSSCTIDEMADCFLLVMTRLKIQKCIAVGSLTMGCYLALSLASRHPERIAGVVCSNLYYIPPPNYFSNEVLTMPATTTTTTTSQSTTTTRGSGHDSCWILQQDGSHMSDIWDKRASWLNPELNTRVTLDNLIYLVKRRQHGQTNGIYIQEDASFSLPMTCWKTTCPVLCINGVQAIFIMDHYLGMDMTGQFQQTMTFFVNPPNKVLMTGTMHMLNENPKEWWSHVDAFAKRIE